MSGLEILGAAASALQIAGTIYDLGKRILEKPKDTKAVKGIVADAKKGVISLQQWEQQMPPQVTHACSELGEKLQSIIVEVESLEKNALEKTFTSLKLYKQTFREKFADALALFQFHMCAQCQLSVVEVDDKLVSLTEKMDKLKIASEVLEGIPGMENSVAKIHEQIKTLSDDMQNLRFVLASPAAEIAFIYMKNFRVPFTIKILFNMAIE